MARGIEDAIHGVHDLAVHGAAVGGMRMADHGRREPGARIGP